MFVAALLTLTTAVMPQGSGDSTPGGADQGQTATSAAPLLSEREQASLRDKLRDYIAADDAYERATGIRDREKTGKTREKAKTRFEDEWDRMEKKGNLLGSMADLRAIYWNSFEHDRPKHSLGRLHERSIDDADLDYSIYVPKLYKADEPQRTLVVLPSTVDPDKPGQNKPGQWTKTRDYFAKVWEDSPLLDDSIVHVPAIPSGLEMDPVPDYSREGAEFEEDRRHRAVLMTFGEIMANYNVDRARVFLDCGRGTCGYGLRLVTLFPDRFAGIILRDPVPVDDIRLGNLLGVDVLMLRTEKNAAVVEALQTRIEASNPGRVAVIEAKGEHPYKESGPDIMAWMEGKQRDMSPKRVVLEPNHDRFNRAYWVDVITADSLLTTAREEQPRLEVEADRENNRIVVKARGIERFELLLNDALVDLDKEFTIVVNDKAVAEQRQRSFRDMHKRMVQRLDWDYLFPVQYVTTVPKE